MGGCLLYADGGPVPFSASKVSRALHRKEVPVELDLGLGNGKAEILSCDLTHEYITINADYRT